jgi:hypothetical protein
MTIKEIDDNCGISSGKLEHIFLGTETHNSISGFHCIRDYNDTKAVAKTRLYSNSKRKITYNKKMKLFEAEVYSKKKKSIKKEKKSSFFNENFERQEIVNLIARLKSSKHIVKEFSAKKSKHIIAQIKLDPTTGLIVVDNRATTYPLIKY